MVVVVFRSRLTSAARSGNVSREYQEWASCMQELASQAEGFVSFKTFQADDGERVSLAEFETEETVAAWKANPKHQEAQGRGREAFYSEYQVQVCTEIRSYRFQKARETQETPQTISGTEP